jgi:thioredoxin-dependent peroxiredoxin
MRLSKIDYSLVSTKFMIITALFAGLFSSCSAQHKHLTVGDPLPQFSLKDDNDSVFNIADYVGKEVLVIYFYPRDESSVCTKEACSFRDNYAAFTAAGARVIGINSGSVESHRKFRTNHNLPFTLLSDPGNKVLKLFGVKSKFLISGRETFVIDKSGKIRFTYDSFINGPAHEAEALAFIKSLPA